MISSVGIDLSRTGRHQVRCLDEQARPCDSFTFDSTLEGLETLEKHVFSDGATPHHCFRANRVSLDSPGDISARPPSGQSAGEGEIAEGKARLYGQNA